MKKTEIKPKYFDRNVVTFTYFTPTDKNGRCRFEMFWFAENHHSGPSWRGQMFYAVPHYYIEKEKQRGRVMQEIDRNGR